MKGGFGGKGSRAGGSWQAVGGGEGADEELAIKVRQDAPGPDGRPAPA